MPGHAPPDEAGYENAGYGDAERAWRIEPQYQRRRQQRADGDAEVSSDAEQRRRRAAPCSTVLADQTIAQRVESGDAHAGEREQQDQAAIAGGETGECHHYSGCAAA